MKDGSYITVQSWMRTELGLTGNELLVYALIYGFSQDNESVFKGSLKYVADWVGCSRQTAITVLKKLVVRGLIERIEENISGVVFVRYKAIPTDSTQFYGWSKILTTPSQEIVPNNTNRKKLENNTTTPTLEEVEQFCKERGNGVDAKRVYDYYSSANWKDGRGNPVRNWKQKIIAVWEKPKEDKQIGKVAHEREVYDKDFNEDGTFKW